MLFGKKSLSEEQLGFLLREAEFYRTGCDGRSKDEKKSLSLYEKAAEAGNTYSQLMAGYMYDFGIGTTPNFNKAKKWYLKASEKGDKDATLNLANIYNSDRHNCRSFPTALSLYQKALSQGSALAANNIASMYLDCIENKTLSLSKAIEKAEPYLYKAIDIGYSHSITLHNFGCACWDNHDDKKAYDFFNKALTSDSSNINARFMIAKCKLYGRGTDVDLEYAKEIFTHLAKEYKDKDSTHFLLWYKMLDKFTSSLDSIIDYIHSDRFSREYSIFIWSANNCVFISFDTRLPTCSREQVADKEDWDNWHSNFLHMQQSFDEFEKGENALSNAHFSSSFKDFVLSPEVEKILVGILEKKFESFRHFDMVFECSSPFKFHLDHFN